VKVYTYTEARQQLASLLDRAQADGSVQIRRRDGSAFVLSPEKASASPLGVPCLDLGLSRHEIVAAVRDGRSQAKSSRMPRRAVASRSRR
jgi:antitoxin (DNA-binding transcriptional repressor) of toxin-antitoxin stability system